jgi:D-Tyr-tRNAtyr deacylase
MAIKNKRTSIQTESKIEERLKKQLKEDYSSFLEADGDEELDAAMPSDTPEGQNSLEDSDTTEDGLGGESLDGGLGSDPSMGGGVNLGDGGVPGEDENVDFTPAQQEFMDKEMDLLLSDDDSLVNDGISGNQEVDGTLLDEAEGDEDLSLGGEEDFDLGGLGGDDMGGENLDVETDEFAAEDSLGGGDDIPEYVFDDKGSFSADELNSLIDGPTTYETVPAAIEDKALEMGDEEPMEESLYEAEGGAENNFPAGKDPMTGLRGDDKGGFDQGYEGKERKDELMEAGEPEGFKSETPSKLEGSFEKAKDGKSKAKEINTKDTQFDKVSQTMKESIKKSKMLVKAAEAIAKLKEANDRLKFENDKLARVNGILQAVGEKLSKDTRKKISEKFEGCKTPKEAKELYEKVVKVIKEKNKAPLNQTVKAANKTQVKSLKESAAAPKQQLTEAQIRRNHLMGLTDEGYWKQ